MNKYMQMAIEEAREGIHNNHGGPFGSVIVKICIIGGGESDGKTSIEKINTDSKRRTKS